MNTNARSGGRIEINVAFLVKMVLSRWWIVLLAAVVGGSVGFFAVQMTKTETYSSSISFVVSNRLTEDEQSYSNSDLNASITLANTYKYILSSRTMCEKVAKTCSYNNSTMSDVKAAIHMKAEADTNILIMTITTNSAAKSYDYALAVIKNYRDVVVNSGYPNTSLTVCELPIAATSPNSDNAALIYMVIGAFVAVLIALIIIMVLQLMRNTIQSAEDISEGLDLRILGLVSRTVPRGKKNSGRALLIDEGIVGFSFVETFKAIRTKVENLAAKKNYKVVLVSSAGESEGKTTVATNLAIALAQTGHSVLLIDADLRKPSICKFLGLKNAKENRTKGLQNVLSGAASFEQAIRYVERHKIFLLAGSSAVSDPAEMLSTQQMDKALRALRKEFDFIIIDTAPAGVVTDASILANYADAAVLVVREDYSSVEKIRNTIDDLAVGTADLIGCVYNNVSAAGAGKAYAHRYGRRYGYGGYGRYGYGRYGYGYGYGYGYTPDEAAADDRD